MITSIEVRDNLGNQYKSINSVPELQHVLCMLKDRGLVAVSLITMTSDGFEVMRKEEQT